MTKDEWVTAALTDDTVVVELLFRLKQSSSDLYASLPAKPPPLLPPLGWGQRQPRSKTATATRKEREPATRCSPTTPLSWSGGAASLSDGYDESSRPSDGFSGDRSKGTFTNETNVNTTHKRSRRKKTFAELKEEESFLLKERIHLKRELSSLRITLKEQRAQSENLKRIKLDMHLQSANKMGSTSDKPEAVISYQCNQMEVSRIDHAPSILARHAASHDDLASSDSCKVPKDVKTQERCCILPDLNMTPSEDDSSSETLWDELSRKNLIVSHLFYEASACSIIKGCLGSIKMVCWS